MSSANLVSVIYVNETVYGTPDTPLSGVTAETTRFTSESLSGSPQTSESTNIRTDRLSSGQVVVGLEVGGDLSIELAAGQFYEDFFEYAMMESWTAQATLSTDVTLTPIDAQSATLTVTGDLSTIPVAASDVLQLIPTVGSPVVVQVISVTNTTECIVATSRDEDAISSVAMTVALPAFLTIGKTIGSCTLNKSYTDVIHEATTPDVHGITYKGSMLSGFNIAASYGEIVTGAFATMGNGYSIDEGGSYQQQIIAAGGTVNPAATTQSLNASLDVSLMTQDGVATTWCTESFNIALDNGLAESTCLGYAAPQNYTLGTAAVSVDLSIYLSDTSFDEYYYKKLTQEPVSMGFTMQNHDGGYFIAMPAVQLTFPDSSSDGQDEQCMIDATGVAKVGPNGESSIKIYNLVGDQ